MQKILSTDDYINGILQKDRIILSKAITLIESTRKEDEAIANVVLEACLKSKKKSHRIAISGAPGAGKSTFINAFGSLLLDNNYSLAVLAVDPSSSISKGSILGDKTRMEDLVRYENCFIRPTASSNNLGGVARSTRETILLCEAFGFDYIFVETVGVGQSGHQTRHHGNGRYYSNQQIRWRPCNDCKNCSNTSKTCLTFIQ